LVVSPDLEFKRIANAFSANPRTQWYQPAAQRLHQTQSPQAVRSNDWQKQSSYLLR